jgi:hypothetical protein
MKRWDLEGLRLIVRGGRSPDVYLVLDGQLHFLDPVLRRTGIFADWGHIWTIDASPGLALEYGQPISSVGTRLVRLDTRILLEVNSAPYRWIRDPETFNRFGFNPDTISGGDAGHSDRGERIYWQPEGNGDLSNITGRIYLMDEGMMRHVVDTETYRDLFGGTGATHMDPFNGGFGPDLDRSVRLVKAPDRPELWLLDNARRRRISSENALRYYGFSRGVVHSMPYGQLVEYPEGRPIVWPTANFALPTEAEATNGAEQLDEAT